MKLNLDNSKSNVCKEDVVMCIIKEVPKYLPDDGEESTSQCSWLGGSHQDIMVGRQNNRPNTETVISRSLTRQQPTPDNTTATESAQEMQIWSTIYTKESTPDKLCKPDKSRREAESLNTVQLRRKAKSSESLKVQMYTKMDDICEDCQQFLKATKKLRAVKTQVFAVVSEFEKYSGVIKCSFKSSDDINMQLEEGNKLHDTDSTSPMYIKTSDKSQVMKLLNEAHARLLECSILLTTQKLKKKLHKCEDEVNAKPSDNDVLLDMIRMEEGNKDGTSKLCLALGRFITKYLKIK